MTEKDIVAAIMRYLKTVPDCFAWKEHGGMYGTAGLPDVICCINGRFVGLEIKTPKGKATALQTAVLRKIRDSGGVARIVRSVEEAEAVIDTILAGKAWSGKA